MTRRTHRIRIWLILTAIVLGMVAFFEYRAFRFPPRAATPSTPVFQEEDLLTMHSEAPPAIESPRWERVALADPHLKDDGLGIDVEINGRHRFYPYQILAWHEVVNDTFRNKPLLIVYVPLAQAGFVYERKSDDTFSASSQIWNSIRFLKDAESGSLWNPVLAEAAMGARKGEVWTRYPSRVMTWLSWKNLYRSDEVLARVPDQRRDYTLDPYAHYLDSQEMWFPVEFSDAQLPVKEPVVGIEVNGQAAAYPLRDLEEGPLQDMVNGVPVSLTVDRLSGAVQATSQGKNILTTSIYWFAWVITHPTTHIYLP